MASDQFLKIDSIDGDSTVDGHVKEIELQSWSLGATVPVGPRSTSGSAAAGTSMHQDLSCAKMLDEASNGLAAACWEGKTIANAVVTTQRQGESGGGKVDYMKILLTDVIVASYNRSGAPDTIPMEMFSLNYATIKVEYFTTDAAGGSGGWQKKGWSVSEEKAI